MISVQVSCPSSPWGHLQEGRLCLRGHLCCEGVLLSAKTFLCHQPGLRTLPHGPEAAKAHVHVTAGEPDPPAFDLLPGASVGAATCHPDAPWLPSPLSSPNPSSLFSLLSLKSTALFHLPALSHSLICVTALFPRFQEIQKLPPPRPDPLPPGQPLANQEPVISHSDVQRAGSGGNGVGDRLKSRKDLQMCFLGCLA